MGFGRDGNGGARLCGVWYATAQTKRGRRGMRRKGYGEGQIEGREGGEYSYVLCFCLRPPHCIPSDHQPALHSPRRFAIGDGRSMGQAIARRQVCGVVV